MSHPALQLGILLIIVSCEATVTPASDFNKDLDAQVLLKILQDPQGTNTQGIVNVLGKRSNAQRQRIIVRYKRAYNRNLVKDLKTKLSGNFKKTILALMNLPALYQAKCIIRAMKGAGADIDALIEIIATKSSQEILALKVAYNSETGTPLTTELVGETTGDLRRLLLGLSTVMRDGSSEVDGAEVSRDANSLLEAAVNSPSIDEVVFQRIFVSRSKQHLLAVFREYQQLAGISIEKTIEHEMVGYLRSAYLTIVAFLQNPHQYFADQLHKAMSGEETDEEQLIRIIVTRSEVDLTQIKEAYADSHGKPLASTIKSHTSGDFCRILIALVGE
ncbi:annexin A11-like [Acanthaster planci]|uniref:Annexin n=1 Tax=Acanthaster planci TaxID=133434 RepID=A0A8B7YD61_ACAPL|nr:annexin A11-like [Acanthaster planci]XP_022089597.1 annexin A11-like [Acanthaster planci]